MKKKYFVAVLMTILCVANTFANNDSLQAKKVNHYVGLQVNELIKQIFNLNQNNTPVIDNPYLLTYSFIFSKTGLGGHAGIGYRYNSFAQQEANNETETNQLFYRAGIIRRSKIGKRVLIGYGLDYAGAYDKEKTTSTTITNFGSDIDSSYSKISRKTQTIGGGLHLDILVHITPRILIGTETNYYFQKATQKENVFVAQTLTDLFSGEQIAASIANSNDESIESKFAITVPIAIFLIVSF